MPCYEAPPQWEGRKIKNAEQAVRILCKQTCEALAEGKTLSRETLEWFLDHRKIDLEIALGSRIVGREEHNRIKEDEAEKARQDIEKVSSMLAAQQ
ncbi:hypothetical protein D3C87_1261490 [compost metagenome]